jgi:hypothetical protein
LDKWGLAGEGRGKTPQIGMPATGSTNLPAPALHDVMGWLDARVRDVTGRRLGRVSAVVADADGTPWWIVIRHRGREVVAPVAAVLDTRHNEVLLDRDAESLPPCPDEIDESAHEALLDRFGLARADTPAGPRGPRDACTPRPARRFQRRAR